MKKVFAVACIVGFLWGITYAFADYQLDNLRGDIAVWSYPAHESIDPDFESDLFKAERQVIELELLYSMWGAVNFWNEIHKPLWYTAMVFSHIELLEANHFLDIADPYSITILRQTSAAKEVFDLNVLMAEYNREKEYKIAFDELDQLYRGEIDRIDFTPMMHPDQTVEQYSAFGNPGFRNRYYNCVTDVAWALVYSWDANYDIKDYMNKSMVVIAVDAVSPGFLFYWLVENKLYYVVETIEFSDEELLIIPTPCDNFFYRLVHPEECGEWIPDLKPNSEPSSWKCPFELGHHSYCAVCEEDDANKDGTAGCDEGEGWCSGSWHCAKGLVCDPETHKCVKPE